MATTTKKDLIDRISTHRSAKRSTVKAVVQDFLDLIVEELGRGNRLEFRDFGVFEVKRRAPRTAQNPKTMERVQVPARHTVRFKAGRLLREQTERSDQHGATLNGTVEVKVKTKKGAGAGV